MVWYITDIPKVREGVEQLDVELKRGSDRSVAILAGSIVESYLTLFLERNTIHHGRMWSELTRPSGALGSFSVKCDLAYMFGFISKDAHDDLKKMKDVRNIAAHRLETFEFSAASIQAKCMALKTVDHHVKKVRNRGSLSYSDIGDGPKFWVGSWKVLSEIKEPRTRYVWAARVFTVAFGGGEGHADRII